MYRVDRSSLNSIHSSGGGVMIAVRLSLSSERISVPGTENVEIVIVKINVGVSSIYVCCIYVPSGSLIVVYESYAAAVQKFLQFITLKSNDSVFVTGDFNMREVTWSPDPDKPSALLPGVISCSGHAALTYSILSSNLSQVNHIPNPQERHLDLVFCTDPDNVMVKNSANTLSRVDFPFHGATEFRFTIADHNVVKPNEKSYYYDFKNAEFEALSEYFSRVDWDHVFENYSAIDELVDKFYELLMDGIDQFVPVRWAQSSNHPTWYTKAIINLKNRRNRAYKKFAKSTDALCKAKYKAMFIAVNKEFQRLTATTYKRYLDGVQNDIVKDPKKFWQYVDSKRKPKGYPSTMSYEGVKAAIPEGICKLFSDFFQKVYVVDDDSSDVQPFGIDKLVDVHSYELTTDEVRRALKRIDTNKGAGPDGISPLILKKCANILSFFSVASLVQFVVIHE